MRGALRRLAAALALTLYALPAPAAESAVILMYHRFGEDDIPSTNIRIDQFEAHLAALAVDGFTVLPVPDIVAALADGTALPDKTIGITIDDAYASAYREAWPRLAAAGVPFTLFVATDAVDEGQRGIMTWDQIRELAAAGVTIGHHSAAHGHMAFADPADNAADLARAARRFEAELGFRPELFAYPFGEYGLALRDTAAEAGFAAAFGQQSGVAHADADPLTLPRFALNEKYGEPERFATAIRALPLPAADVTPDDPALGPNPPPFGFTVAADIDGLDRLDCFVSGQPDATVERIAERRFEVRLTAPFPPGRSRVNCTAPGPQGRWRWFGIQFVVPPD